MAARSKLTEQRSRTTGGSERVVFLRRLALLALLIGALVLVEAGVYAVLEGSSFGYGIVWVIDTVTTVGAIAEPHSSGARALRAIVEITGIGTLFYVLVTVVESSSPAISASYSRASATSE